MNRAARAQRTRASEAKQRVTRGQASLRLLGSVERYAIDMDEFRVGSAPDNDLVLDDAYVSNVHCVLRWVEDALWVVDASSRNGTHVNNVRVQRCALPPRARIDIGHTTLQIAGRPVDGPWCGVVGGDQSMQRVMRQVERLAPTRYPVLLLGETGTGKDVIARAIHHASGLHGPFEAINCAAIPRDLAESELFGYEKGAFTGAVEPSPGAFQRAEGGTLFLDEIGEMPRELQAKLLRVLEERKVRPVGGSERPIEVRVVSATHRALAQEARRGRFREDLYYRLAVGVLELPPLRERGGDVALLARHFVEEEALRVGRPLHLEDGALDLLARHSWPGNVRALRHAIQRAVAFCDRDRLTRSDFDMLGSDVSRDPSASACQVGESGANVASDGVSVRYSGRPFADVRREIYLGVLRDTRGNRTAAAVALGIPKSTFFDQLRAMGLG